MNIEKGLCSHTEQQNSVNVNRKKQFSFVSFLFHLGGSVKAGKRKPAAFSVVLSFVTCIDGRPLYSYIYESAGQVQFL
jgi:hypothetical protein